jgi:hypothetical protein
MKNVAKLIVVLVFALGAVFAFLSSFDLAKVGSVLAQVAATPTPAANVAANTPANTNANAAKPPAAGDKKMTKSFTLAKDSLDEVHGEVPFDHDTHAFGKYSPDGTAVIGCIECHHTDQPKSALKPPLATSERDVVLTFDAWKASNQKVNECRACHFQAGATPDGKEMPVLGGKDLDNQLAYHLNCNTCHDAAFKARPALKSKNGFATGKDCLICHVKNN